MNKNSVLFLTNTYPDFDKSYRGIFIKKMASLLEKEGYRVSVVTPKIFKGSRFTEKNGDIAVYRFPFLSGNKLLIEYKKIPYARMMLYYLSGFVFTFWTMLRHRCSLIHVHWAIPTGVIGILAGSLLKKPVIVTVHGSDFRMATEGSSLLRKIFLRVCKRAKYVTCVSEGMRREIIQLGIEGEKILAFPMGVEGTFLEAGRKRMREGISQPTVLSNRNLLPIYNVSQLIRAIPIVVKEVPGATFLIAGEGVEREKLEQEARRLNVSSSVEFLGRVPHEEMPGVLSRADVYVSTSLSDGTSVSLLEAMAAGTFPVVTAIKANLEWISDGHNGFLFPVGNETTLAEKIVEAIRNERLIESVRADNRRIVEDKATWKMNITKITGLYQSVF